MAAAHYLWRLILVSIPKLVNRGTATSRPEVRVVN